MRSHSHVFPRRHRSVFIRLLTVLLATMGLVHLLIGGAFGLLSRSGSAPYMKSNIQHYAEYIVHEIGAPPDTVRARELADEYLLYIQYEDARFKWSSGSKMPKKPHGIGPSSMWRQPFIVENEDGSRILLSWRFGPWLGAYRSIFVGLLIIVTLLFAGAHGAIRHVLRPIRWLRSAVDDIGSGNLDIQIPIDRNDELGRLSEAFNEMVQRIKRMLNARDQLLLDVSHELRSPLTRIRVAMEFIEDNEKKKGILSDIAEIETMLTEILETERLTNKHGWIILQSTDLVLLLKETCDTFAGRLPGIDLTGLPEILMLPLDAERIRTLLKNLIENAVKFSRPESRPVRIVLQATAGRVQLEVIDDGMGVPESQIPFLFEPFFRVDRSRTKITKGYGLGLHLCKKIMEAHEGEIHLCNNQNGNGLTVSLIFKY